MYVEITFFAMASALLLFWSIFMGVIKFGLQWSYSSYAPLWEKTVPLNNMNVWSVFTLMAAFFLCPAMLELAAGSALQFLGFLTPVYLMVVALTPEFQTVKAQFIIHVIASCLCAIGCMFWLVCVMGAWKIAGGVAVFIATLALFSGTQKSSLIFWLEMIMFLSVYIVLFTAIL